MNPCLGQKGFARTPSSVIYGFCLSAAAQNSRSMEYAICNPADAPGPLIVSVHTCSFVFRSRSVGFSACPLPARSVVDSSPSVLERDVMQIACHFQDIMANKRSAMRPGRTSRCEVVLYKFIVTITVPVSGAKREATQLRCGKYEEDPDAAFAQGFRICIDWTCESSIRVTCPAGEKAGAVTSLLLVVDAHAMALEGAKSRSPVTEPVPG